MRTNNWQTIRMCVWFKEMVDGILLSSKMASRPLIVTSNMFLSQKIRSVSAEMIRHVRARLNGKTLFIGEVEGIIDSETIACLRIIHCNSTGKMKND